MKPLRRSYKNRIYESRFLRLLPQELKWHVMSEPSQLAYGGPTCAHTIADMAAYPWAAPYTLLNQDIDDFPHLERWLDAIAGRAATQRAYALAKQINPNAPQPQGPRSAKTPPILNPASV